MFSRRDSIRRRLDYRTIVRYGECVLWVDFALLTFVPNLHDVDGTGFSYY